MRGAILFPMDLIMDLCALIIVQLAFDRLNIKRLALAELLLAACTTMTLALGKPPPILQFAVLLTCAFLVTGERRILRIGEAAICILCTFGAAAGIAALPWMGAPLYAPIGAILFLWLLRRRRNVRLQWNIELNVEKDGTGDAFPALIDTGNRLRERRSGLPVLIVEESAMPHLSALALHLPKSQIRTMPFGALGGGGELSCFRADHIQISAAGIRPRPAPDCWVAVYPGQIPGLTRALAPPEFAEVLQGNEQLSNGIHHLARRLYHGFFKCQAIHLWARGSNSQRNSMLHRRQRSASTATDSGRRNFPGAQGQCRGHAGALDHD